MHLANVGQCRDHAGHLIREIGRELDHVHIGDALVIRIHDLLVQRDVLLAAMNLAANFR